MTYIKKYARILATKGGISVNKEELLKLKKELTGYPSIDKTHEKNWKFSDRHPMIPGVSVYNAFNLMTKEFDYKYAVDCLDLKVKYS